MVNLPLMRAIALASVAIMLLPAAAQANHDEVVAKDGRFPVQVMSVSTSGKAADGDSGGSSGLGCTPWDGIATSDDGRLVAFTSRAGNLHPGDSNGSVLTDVFLRNRRKGTTELVSSLTNGLAPPIPPVVENLACVAWSAYPAISGNGRFVAFASRALLTNEPMESTTLLPAFRVYVRDMKTGKVELISKSHDGSPDTGDSGRGETGTGEISISDDGRYVAFESNSTNLVPEESCAAMPVNPRAGANGCRAQIYLYDRKTDRMRLVSRPVDGGAANGSSRRPDISDDGRTIVFESEANNLLEEDVNVCPPDQGFPSCFDVYAYDVAKEKLELISVTPDGIAGDSWSFLRDQFQGEQISSDGRHVLFESAARNITPTCSGIIACGNVFVRDRRTGRTDRVSVTSTGRTFAGSNATISDNGRFVLTHGAYCAGATQPSCEHDAQGWYLHDRRTGQTDLLDRTVGGDTHPGSGVISGDGRNYFWVSRGESAQGKDVNQAWDVLGRALGWPGLGVEMGTGKVPLRSSEGRRSTTLEIRDEAHDVSIPLPEADIIDTRISFRPSLDDVFARIDLERLPLAPARALVGYGIRFRVSERIFEIRISRSGLAPSFELFRCATGTALGSEECETTATLKGGYGTVGHAVVAAIPAAVLGDGGKLSGVEAFSTLPGRGVLDVARMR